jgi:hypothetical protein
MFVSGFLFNFGKQAGKTVAEQAHKVKSTLEEKVISVMKIEPRGQHQ